MRKTRPDVAPVVLLEGERAHEQPLEEGLGRFLGQQIADRPDHYHDRGRRAGGWLQQQPGTVHGRKHGR